MANFDERCYHVSRINWDCARAINLILENEWCTITKVFFGRVGGLIRSVSSTGKSSVACDTVTGTKPKNEKLRCPQ